MSDKKPIGFFRRGGKVIPIFKTKKQRMEAAQGTGLLTAGAVTTVGGSYTSGKLIKKARKIREFSVVGSQNIKASQSSRVSLKRMALREGKYGIVNIPGPKKKMKSKQLSLFDFGADKQVKKFKIDKRVSAYRRAFLSKKILAKSHTLSHGAVGLGVDKLIESFGIEKDIGNEYASEVAGVLAFGGLESLGRNTYLKTSEGKKFRQGIKKDVRKGIKKLRPQIKAGQDLAVKFIRRKLKI